MKASLYIVCIKYNINAHLAGKAWIRKREWGWNHIPRFPDWKSTTRQQHAGSCCLLLSTPCLQSGDIKWQLLYDANIFNGDRQKLLFFYRVLSLLVIYLPPELYNSLKYFPFPYRMLGRCLFSFHFYGSVWFLFPQWLLSLTFNTCSISLIKNN